MREIKFRAWDKAQKKLLEQIIKIALIMEKKNIIVMILNCH